MKRMLTLIILLIFSIGISKGQGKPMTADQLMNQAIKHGKKEGKKIFVLFGASWCHWCHTMEAVLKSKDVKDSFDQSFITVYMTIDERGADKVKETPGGSEFKTRHTGLSNSIPFWMIFDSKGKFITDARIREGPGQIGANTGCPARPHEVEYFIKVLKQSSKMTAEELETIGKKFTKLNTNGGVVD